MTQPDKTEPSHFIVSASIHSTRAPQLVHRALPSSPFNAGRLYCSMVRYAWPVFLIKQNLLQAVRLIFQSKVVFP